MDNLLYCIFHQTDAAAEPCPGIQAQPIALVHQSGLTAAISPLVHPPTPADLDWLIAYQKAMEFFHRHSTIIPMRYGSAFPDKSQLRRFLAQHRGHYGNLLRELEGCVEMGIRIVGQEHRADAGQEHPAQGRAKPKKSAGSGMSYLHHRKTYYAVKDHATEQSGAALQTLQARFTGLYAKSKMEMDPSRLARNISRMSMGALYFLVPERLLPAFCSQFERLNREDPAQLLLSGPWPPYNFVA